MSEDWLRIIKEKMESHETPAPEGVWEDVESRLFPEKTFQTRRFAPWVWAIAAAAALALGVFAGVRLIDRGNGRGDIFTDDDRIAEGPASPKDTTISSSADNRGGQEPSRIEPIQIVPAPAGAAIAVVSPDLSGEEIIPDVSRDLVPQEIIEIPTEVAEPPVEVAELPVGVVEPPVEKAVDQDKDKKDTGFKTTHDGEDWSKYMSATSEDASRRTGGPSAGLSLSSAARGYQQANTLDTRPFFQGYAANMDPATRDGSSIYTRTVSIPVTKDEEHRRPIRMSLSIDFPVTDVLSVGSGLTCSILQSKFSTSSGTRVSEEIQTLGYLGLPVNLKANVLNGDRLTLYASGGGMVEKCVSAISKTTVTVGGEKISDGDKRSFSVKPLVWSLNSAAGLQVNLAGGIGIYAEPGVSYHFPDGSKFSSVYTAHPFDFVMTFGARYSFR